MSSNNPPTHPGEGTHPAPATRSKAGAGQAWVLIFANFLPIMAIIALGPALPTLMAHFHDVPNAQTSVPTLITAPGLCIALLAPFAGLLVDHFGRRRLMLFATAIYGVGGIAPLFMQSFGAVLTGRFVLGVAEAFILTIASTLLADYFTEEERHKWLAVQGAVGPFLATFMIEGSGHLAAMGWQYPFTVYALAFPIFLFACKYLWEPPKPPKQPKGEVILASRSGFPVGTVLFICSITLFTATLFFVQGVQFGRILGEVGVKDPASVGRINAIVSIAVPFAAFIYKSLAKRSVYLHLLVIFFFMGLGYIGMGLAHDGNAVRNWGLIQQLGQGMTVPPLIAWSLSLLPPEHRGRGMGFWTSSFFVGQFVSPAVVTFVAERTGGFMSAIVAFGVMALVASLMAGIAFFVGQQKQKGVAS